MAAGKAAAPKGAVSAKARAKAKAASVVREAGAEGHLVPQVPRRTFRTDLVPPVLSFVVYGVPAPQGSKEFKGYRGGKPVLVEQSKGVDPWRDAVRRMARKAIQDHAKRTGRPWSALDEPVMVSAVVTMGATEAATKRGDIYATGTPDLDKLERAIGDALAPAAMSPSVGKGLPEAARKQVREKTMAQRRAQSVLHDDSRIAVWDHVCKVYPSTTVDSLGYSGVTIRVWLMKDLERAERKPVVRRSGSLFMQAQDLRAWARPLSGLSWDDEAAQQWKSPQAVLSAEGPVVLRGRGINEVGIRATLRALALLGPTSLIEVVDEPLER